MTIECDFLKSFTAGFLFLKNNITQRIFERNFSGLQGNRRLYPARLDGHFTISLKNFPRGAWLQVWKCHQALFIWKRIKRRRRYVNDVIRDGFKFHKPGRGIFIQANNDSACCFFNLSFGSGARKRQKSNCNKVD